MNGTESHQPEHLDKLERVDGRGRQELLGLPEEILEHVLCILPPRDLISIIQTCQFIKHLYESSPALRYQFVLETSGYANVPNRSIQSTRASSRASPRGNTPENSTQGRNRSSSPVARQPSPLSTVIKSPHTGAPRPALSTVSLAPWPVEPPATRQDFSRLSKAEKNVALRARERRWATLEPAQVRTFRVAGRAGVYELQEGIFLVCQEENTRAKPRRIRFIPLPSVNDPDLEDPILHTMALDMKFPIADLTMDPTHDLIVVSEHQPDATGGPNAGAEYRFHLLRISTGKPHPLASMPTLDFPPMTVPTDFPRQLIQVMGDTLVVAVSCRNAHLLLGDNQQLIFFGNGEEEMVAWNWKTGAVLGRIHLGHATTASSTFIMLTPTTVAVALPAVADEDHEPMQPMIKILSFAQPPLQEGEVVDEIEQPLHMDREDVNTPRAIAVASLRFPQLARESQIETFHVRPDPPFPVPQRDQDVLGKGKPFTQDSRRGVVVFELEVRPRGATPEKFELFVLREKLIALAEEGEARRRAVWAEAAAAGKDTIMETEAAVQRTYKWEEWGEQHSRFMTPIMTKSRLWVCTCSGYRFASLVDDLDDDMEAPTELLICDFNPYAMKQDQVRARSSEGVPIIYSTEPLAYAATSPDDPAFGDSEYIVEHHTEPTILGPSRAFVRPIRSSLPYRSVRRQLPGEPDGVMIDDQRVIITQSVGRRTDTELRQITVWCM